MQVELSKFNERLIGEFKAKSVKRWPGYDGSHTTIANVILTSWLVRELKVKPKKK